MLLLLNKCLTLDIHAGPCWLNWVIAKRDLKKKKTEEIMMHALYILPTKKTQTRNIE